MAYKRNSIEVPELEILLAGKKKKYVRYEEGAILYSLGINSFRQIAQDAHAIVRLKRIALVNVEVLDEYAPSVSQAKRIKELAQKGQFNSDAVVAIMGEEKKSELDTVTIKNETLRKYFPRNYTPRQMEQKIIQLLEAWQQQKQQAKLKKKQEEAR